MPKIFIIITLLAHLSSCGQTSGSKKDSYSQIECGPDASVECSFLNMPDNVGSVLNIPVDAGLSRLIISGRIFKADGVTPYPDVLLYVYHTDAAGEYSKNGTEKGVQKWHGRHHGWVKTDRDGRYSIKSIRPAQYPGNTIAAHIHATVRETDKKPYWINDFVFKDDPLVTDAYKATQRNPGGDGVVDLKFSNGRWEGVRNIVLKK